MKKSILLLLVSYANIINAQDSIKVDMPKKPNQIIFFEYYLGLGGGNTSGWSYGLTLNYQVKKDLFTFRLGGFTGFENRVQALGPTVGLPVFDIRERIVDYSVLYGKRWIGEGTSFSVSGGVSSTNWKHYEPVNDVYEKYSENTIGFPFELNVKWFKKVKRRFRAYYGLVPIGKGKVAFGRSYGFKLVGNISKADYIGFAFNVGFGCHKKY
jgi:hypothetical protein